MSEPRRVLQGLYARSEPIEEHEYKWLLRRIEEDKWPVLFDGGWLWREPAMDIVRQYEESQ